MTLQGWGIFDRRNGEFSSGVDTKHAFNRLGFELKVLHFPPPASGGPPPKGPAALHWLSEAEQWILRNADMKRIAKRHDGTVARGGFGAAQDGPYRTGGFVANSVRVSRLLLILAATLGAAGFVIARSAYSRSSDPARLIWEQPAFGNQQTPAIHSEANTVNLDVVVTDEDGRVLNALKKENFRVLDNGRPQAIANFAPSSAPITIAVLMEYSSTAYNYFAYKAASWAPLLLDHLKPQDWVALVTYDLKPTIRVDFTRNKANVRDAFSTLSFPQFREANLFDAVLDTVNRLEGVKGKKSLLLISTGANSFSSNTLNDVTNRLGRTDVTIFCIGLAESEYLSMYGTNVAYLQAKNQLDTFADRTGGIAYFPRFQGELPDIFRSVAGFLRSQYSLGFSPSNFTSNGTYHKLKVEIVAADGKPLKVRNEKGKIRKVVVYARQGYFASKAARP